MPASRSLPHRITRTVPTYLDRQLRLSITPAPCSLEERSLIFNHLHHLSPTPSSGSQSNAPKKRRNNLLSFRFLGAPLPSATYASALLITRTAALTAHLLSTNPLTLPLTIPGLNLLLPSTIAGHFIEPLINFTPPIPSPRSPLARQRAHLNLPLRHEPTTKTFQLSFVRSTYNYTSWIRRQPFYGPWELKTSAARHGDVSFGYLNRRKEAPAPVMDLCARPERRGRDVGEERERLGEGMSLEELVGVSMEEISEGDGGVRTVIDAEGRVVRILQREDAEGDGEEGDAPATFADLVEKKRS